MEGVLTLNEPGDLQHHQLIHDTSLASMPAFPTWRDWHEASGLPTPNVERGLRINDFAAAYRMAIAGTGVAMGRTTLVEEDLLEGRLTRPFGPELQCSLGYHVVCRPQDADDPTIIAFRNWLIEEANPSRSALSNDPLAGACVRNLKVHGWSLTAAQPLFPQAHLAKSCDA